MWGQLKQNWVSDGNVEKIKSRGITSPRITYNSEIHEVWEYSAADIPHQSTVPLPVALLQSYFVQQVKNGDPVNKLPHCSYTCTAVHNSWMQRKPMGKTEGHILLAGIEYESRYIAVSCHTLWSFNWVGGCEWRRVRYRRLVFTDVGHWSTRVSMPQVPVPYK